MGVEEWQTYCPRCQRLTLGRRDTPNHVLHFLVTFLTCGLWAFVWLGTAVLATRRPYLCTICGTRGVNR
jgi:hypothetical protein